MSPARFYVNDAGATARGGSGECGAACRRRGDPFNLRLLLNL
jgi:hypothetical protein